MNVKSAIIELRNDLKSFRAEANLGNNRLDIWLPSIAVISTSIVFLLLKLFFPSLVTGTFQTIETAVKNGPAFIPYLATSILAMAGIWIFISDYIRASPPRVFMTFPTSLLPLVTKFVSKQEEILIFHHVLSNTKCNQKNAFQNFLKMGIGISFFLLAYLIGNFISSASFDVGNMIYLEQEIAWTIIGLLLLQGIRLLLEAAYFNHQTNYCLLTLVLEMKTEGKNLETLRTN